MDQLSPAVANIIVLTAALFLYGLVWWTSRNMSRFAKVLARLSPVGLVIPLVIYVAAFTAGLGNKQSASKSQPEPPALSLDKGAPVPKTASKEIEADVEQKKVEVEQKVDIGQQAGVEQKIEVGQKVEVGQKAEGEPKVEGEQKPEPSAGESAQ